jgi:hypothetical protein
MSMTRPLATLGALCLLGTVCAGAQAATEDLALDNATFLTAQNVDPFALDPSGSFELINVFGVRGTVFGGVLVDDDLPDFYSFTVGPNMRVTLSVSTPEGPLFGNDPLIGLFDVDGELLAVNYDGGAGYDASFSYDLLVAGTYFAAVAGYPDFDFIGDSTSTDYLYQLTIEAAPVPVPPAIALLGTACVVLAARRRRT